MTFNPSPGRLLAILVLVLFVANVEAQSIFTVAGGGTDDGRPATLASLFHPQGLAIDEEGNLFIAETYANRVRRVSSRTGIITTIAGTGDSGSSGDGGPATLATLHWPSGVALDGQGRLFVADFNNLKIREVDLRTGIITTAAGTGSKSAPFFAGDFGPATLSKLSEPADVAIGPLGDIYVCDAARPQYGPSNNRIRRIAADTRVITTVVGDGEEFGFGGDGGPATKATVNQPVSVAIDRNGDFYFADSKNNRIRKVDGASGTISTVAGIGSYGYSGDGGAATAAGLSWPYGVAVDRLGHIFIADTYNGRVRRVDRETGLITTVAAKLNSPFSVATFGADSLYISNSGWNKVERLDLRTGVLTTVAGNGAQAFSGDGGPATQAQLVTVNSIALGSDGHMFIADTFSGRIHAVSPAGRISTISTFINPFDIAIDDSGTIFVADPAAGKVYAMAFDGSGRRLIAGNGSSTSSGDGGPATEAGLAHPGLLALDGAGSLLIGEFGSQTIRRVNLGSGIITTAVHANVFSGAMSCDSSGNLYVAEAYEHRILRFDAGTGPASVVAGTGVAGTDGDGGPATQAQLSYPGALTFDSSGNLYVGERGRVRMVSRASGIISTVAGDGAEGTAGDGGPAKEAKLTPTDVEVDSRDNVFISTPSRVRAVFACVSVPPTSLVTPGDGSAGVSVTPRLEWMGTTGALRFDIYVDTSNPPQHIVASDVETTSFAPSGLESLTTYYWKVVAKGDPFCDPFRSAESEVWSFTTTSSCEKPGTPR